RRPEPLRGDRLHDGHRGSRRELRLGRDRGLPRLRRRRLGHPRSGRDDEADLRLPPLARRQLLGDRRLRRRRPGPPHAPRSLSLRRLLRGPTTRPHAPPRSRDRQPPTRPRGPLPHLVRRRRRPPPLRHLPGGPGLPPDREVKGVTQLALSARHVCELSVYSGLMESSRQTWNDARMDEFAQRTEENFREVRAKIKSETQGLRTEMNERFALLEAKLDRRFDILFGALATGFIA